MNAPIRFGMGFPELSSSKTLALACHVYFSQNFFYRFLIVVLAFVEFCWSIFAK